MPNQGCIYQRCTHLRAQLSCLPQGHFLCPNQHLQPPVTYSHTLVRAGETIGTSIPWTSWRDKTTFLLEEQALTALQGRFLFWEEAGGGAESGSSSWC